jgi:hypothetical protein
MEQHCFQFSQLLQFKGLFIHQRCSPFLTLHHPIEKLDFIDEEDNVVDTERKSVGLPETETFEAQAVSWFTRDRDI